MPPAKCRKSTQDVRKKRPAPAWRSREQPPNGHPRRIPLKARPLRARNPRSPQKPNAMRDRRMHRARKREGAHRARCAPSPRTAARHSSFGLFLLHLVEKALQDEADDHDDYDRDYDRNRPTWHHNATPFPLYMRRLSPTGRRPAPNVVIKQYYRAFTRRATAPRAHR